jgi:polyhydroxyalkanoate synthesis regulator phasin
MAKDAIVEIGLVSDQSSLNELRRGIQGALTNVPLSVSVSNVDNKQAKAFEQLNRQYANAKEKLDDFKRAQEQAGRSSEDFARKLGISTTRLAAYLIPAGAIFKLASAFDKAKDSVIEINAEINKLTQILDTNASRSSKIADQVLKVAEKYGQSAKDILTITNTIAQAGNKFSSGDTIVKTVEAIAKTKVASTFGDIKETTEGTIAALNQFNLSGERTVEVLDLANQLAKKFAFESGDLFTAVKSGGAAFAVAGGNIQEFAATVSTIRQLTRVSSATIGTGLNTIALRSLRPDVVAFTDKLTDGKIRNADGTLKNITQRFIEIAKATKDFDDERLAQVINILSGDRQGKLLVPFLRDLQKGSEGASVFGKNLEEALKAPGSLSRDAITGMQRLDVQLQSIGTRFEEVFKKLGENKGIQNLVEDFAKLAKGLASIIDAAGPLIPVLLKLGTIKLSSSIFQAYPKFAEGIGSLAPNKVIEENNRRTVRQEAYVASLGAKIANFSHGPNTSSIPVDGSSIPLVNGTKSAAADISSNALFTGAVSILRPHDSNSITAEEAARLSALVNRENELKAQQAIKRQLIKPGVSFNYSSETSQDPLDRFFRDKGYAPTSELIGLDPYIASGKEQPFNLSKMVNDLGHSPILNNSADNARIAASRAFRNIGSREIFPDANPYLSNNPPGQTTFRPIASQFFDPSIPLINSGNFGEFGTPATQEIQLRKRELSRISARKFFPEATTFTPIGQTVPRFDTGEFGIPLKEGPRTFNPNRITDGFVTHAPSQALQNATRQVQLEKEIIPALDNYLKILKQRPLTEREVDEKLIPYAETLDQARKELSILSGTETQVANANREYLGVIKEAIKNRQLNSGLGELANIPGTVLPEDLEKAGPSKLSSLSKRGLAGLKKAGPLLLSILVPTLLEQVSQGFDSEAEKSRLDNQLTQGGIEKAISRKNSQKIASGFFSGAANGALIGSSFFGPQGLAIGAAVGGVGGAISANSSNQERVLQELGVAASNQSTAAGVAKFSIPLLNRLKGSSSNGAIDRIITGESRTTSNLDQFLGTESGQAFRQRLRSFASEEAQKVAGSDTGDSQTVFANLSEKFTKQFEEQGFSHDSALSKANKLAAIALKDFSQDIDATIETVRNTRNKIKEQLTPVSTLVNYISDLNRQTAQIATVGFGRSVGNQFRESVSGSFFGGGPSTQGFDQIGKLLFDQMQTAISKIDVGAGNKLPSRNAIGNVVDRFSGGFLNAGEKAVFADIGSIQQFGRFLAKTTNEVTGNLHLDESNKVESGIVIKQVLDKINPAEVRNSLGTEEGKRFFDDVIKGFKEEVDKNPELGKGDPTQLAAALTKRLQNAALEKFNAIVQNLNEQLRANIDLYKEQRGLQERQLEVESRSIAFGVQRAQNRRALGDNSFDIIAGLSSTINQASGFSSADTGRLLGDLNGAQGRLTDSSKKIASGLGIDDFKSIIGQTPDQIAGLAKLGGKDLGSSLKEFTDAQIDVAKAHDALKDESYRTANTIAALRSRFEELNKIIESTIATNQKIGFTPFDQRRQANRGQLQFGALTGDIQSVLKANNIGSVQDLAKLPDDVLQNLITRAATVSQSKTFQESAGTFGGVLGGRQADGFRQGTTNQNVIDILAFLAGAGTKDAFGKAQDLGTFKGLLNQRNQDFDSITKGELLQINLLRDINTSIREGLHLPPVDATSKPVSIAPIKDANGNLIGGTAFNAGTSASDIGKEIAKEITAVIKDGGSKTSITFDGNFNISGLEAAGKDVVFSGITVKMMETFASQLDSSDPAQAALKEKLILSIKQFSNK